MSAQAFARAGQSVLCGATWTTDAPFRETAEAIAARRRDGLLAVEMEAAALFSVGARAEVPVGCVLAISDTFEPGGERHRIDDDSLLQAAEAMGSAAVAALAG